jgi:hypothetical protein
MAALLVTLLSFEWWWLSKFAGNSKATGVPVFAGIALEGALSPLFWALAVSLFALFFAAGRLSSRPLRILLFWTPVTAISTLGIGIATLFTYMWLHFRQG